MSPLEKKVVETLLDQRFNKPDLTKHILQSLVVRDREFSEDLSDKRKCVGFYLNFLANSFLSDLDDLPHHISIHLNRNDLPAGGDFILFISPGGEIAFLEATFFGNSLLINDLISSDHAFILKD